MKPISIIIRASGEKTLGALVNQINKFKTKDDDLVILDDTLSFEKKLHNSFLEAIRLNNEFALIIDADILLSCNIRKLIDTCIIKLNNDDLGFGLKLFDKFYGSIKYRGIHVYRVSMLHEILDFLPEEGKELRPESFIKEKAKEFGYHWRNNISDKIVGLHDYFQNYEDIYYKFFIRAVRSNTDVEKLKSRFESIKYDDDYKVALKGLNDGLLYQFEGNNKAKILEKYFKLNKKLSPSDFYKKNTELLLYYEILKNMGFIKLIELKLKKNI